MAASLFGRTDNIDIAIAQLHKHFVDSKGEVLSLLDLQRWFKNELDRTPSTTTLQKARDKFVESMQPAKHAHFPGGDPTSALARAEALLRSAIEGEANIRIQEAERTASLEVAQARSDALAAEQRATLLISDAERRADASDHARRSVIDAYESAQTKAAEAFGLMVATQNQQLSQMQSSMLALTANLAKAETDLSSSAQYANAVASELAAARDLLEQTCLQHRAEIGVVRAESNERERTSSLQISENNKFWAAQVSDLKTQLQVAQKALLASKTDVESAIGKARHEAVAGLVEELKKLIVMMAGANTLYNTHAGAMRMQVEQLTTVVESLQKHLSIKIVESETKSGRRGVATKVR